MLFSLYGLEMDVPKEYKIQIYKGSLFYEGTFEITDFEDNLIRVDWNELGKLISQHQSPSHYFQDYLDKVKSDKEVVELRVEEFPVDPRKGHDYYFHKLSYTTARKFPKKEIRDFIIGFGIYCYVSNRLVIIQYRPPQGKVDFEEKALEIIKSFRCRCED
jgi:hypothetical protein